MEEKQSKGSLFATIPGVLVLLALAVLSDYFHAWMLAAFFFLLFFLCSAALLWSRRLLRRIGLSVEMLQEGCHVGESLSLKLQLRNHSFFPLIWMDVVLPVGTEPLVRQEGEEAPFWYIPAGGQKAQAAVRQRVVWLLWQQEIGWQEELTAIRRGTAELTGADLFAGDGSGLSAFTRRYPFAAPVAFTIYPRLLPVDVQPFLRISQEAVRKRGQTEDVTLLRGSRPYQPGDPMKRINWRILAGSGRMEANVYETVTLVCVTFVLDLLSFRVVKEMEDAQGGRCREVFLRERELERMISLTASCIRELAERRIAVALAVPAFGSREAVFCAADPSTCLKELARLEYRAEPVEPPGEELWQMACGMGIVCICTRRDQRRPWEELTGQLDQYQVRYLAGEKTSEKAPGSGYLYGEDICQDRTVYQAAEEEMPLEVRIGPLRGEEDTDKKQARQRIGQQWIRGLHRQRRGS